MGGQPDPTTRLPCPQRPGWTPAPCSSRARPGSSASAAETGTPAAHPCATATTARTTASARTPGAASPCASECGPRARGWGEAAALAPPGLQTAPRAAVAPDPRARCCRCPVGSDYWFMGLRCDYKVTHQGLLGAACGVLLSVALVGAVIAGLVIRRVKTLLLEAKVDQTKSR